MRQTRLKPQTPACFSVAQLLSAVAAAAVEKKRPAAAASSGSQAHVAHLSPAHTLLPSLQKRTTVGTTAVPRA